MDLNVKTIFFMIQSFLPFLRVEASPETPSNVINIASIDGCGKLNTAYNYAYGASKAGVIQLDRLMGRQPGLGGSSDKHNLTRRLP